MVFWSFLELAVAADEKRNPPSAAIFHSAPSPRPKQNASFFVLFFWTDLYAPSLCSAPQPPCGPSAAPLALHSYTFERTQESVACVPRLKAGQMDGGGGQVWRSAGRRVFTHRYASGSGRAGATRTGKARAQRRDRRWWRGGEEEQGVLDSLRVSFSH